MSPQRATLYVDGYSLGDLGLIVEDVGGADGEPLRRWRTAEVLDRPGAVLLDAEPTVPPRDLAVSGVLVAASRATLRAAFDILLYRLGRGEITVRLADDAARVLKARFVGADLGSSVPRLVARKAPVSIQLTCLDPLWYAASPTVVAFGGATAMPLGTARSRPVLTLTGATNPVVTYKTAAAATKRTMQLAGAGTYVIDAVARTITKNGLPAAADLTAGDFMELDPVDGDLTAGTPPGSAPTYPTLEVSGASGSASYLKAWL